MKKLLVLLLCCLMLAPCALATEEEEDISFDDILATATPDPFAATETPAPPEPTATPEVQPDGSVIVEISAVGDITIGKNAQYSGTPLFTRELERQNGDPTFIFRNTKDILSQDDLTIANLECTLADEYSIPSKKRENDYLFVAPTEYVKALTAGSVEAVAFENNHVMDFGQDGVNSTTAVLDAAGIAWSNAETMCTYVTQGVKIAMFSYQTFDGRYPDLFERVPQAVAAAKTTHDIVIVSFHWGDELDYMPNKNQQKLAKLTIDGGADLVLGHHSHRINPIEEYNGKYIVYSLANFSFCGHNKPDDMSTFIFQIRFKVKNGDAQPIMFRIVPCRISSRTDYNDFIPTPFKEGAIEIESMLTVLRNNGQKALENPVSSYPLDWE